MDESIRRIWSLAIAMIAGAVLAFIFSNLGNTIGVLFVVVFLLGVSLQATNVGLNLSSVRIYDTQSRSTGTGWMMGIGKIGGIIGPMIAGLLFAAGYNKIIVIGLVFMVPFLFAALAYMLIDAKAVKEVTFE